MRKRLCLEISRGGGLIEKERNFRKKEEKRLGKAVSLIEKTKGRLLGKAADC